MIQKKKIRFWKTRGKQILKVENEKWERQIIHLNEILHKIKKEKNSTIEKKFDQCGNKVSMFETLNEVDEEIATKENDILLTR